MRRLTDDEGRVWDVVVGRESWGALYALFVPVGTGARVRQTLLSSAGYDAAQAELDGMEQDRLLRLLAESTPKEE